MYRYLICLISVVSLAGQCCANYCRDGNLCCTGRDSSCVIQKSHPNSLIEDSDKPCYCDHACLKLGDCCEDFKETCGVIDCEVSPWEPWSQCDALCGSGSMVRSRKVLQAPAHGGKKCPVLVQRRVCHEHHGCSAQSDLPLRGEMAMILPGALSHSRHSNDTVDIRKNLRLRNPDDPESNTHKEYCLQYEILKSTKACLLDSDYKSLNEGETICVRCESAALKRNLDWRCGGHGVAGHSTRFSAILAPHCHGKWIRSEETLDKNSECCLTPDFIFV